MRQGDGSDLLGPGDPRSTVIGILYVEARDSRQDILTAVSTQELQGCKQIAIVLPEQGKAFRQPLDFDGLKNMRRQLKAQLIFIAPSGPGPAEFARQRRFVVYSSLDTFKTALLNETIPTTNPRMKAQPGSTKKSGILDFGARKTRASKQNVPATPQLPPVPPTPRLPNQSAPPTPRLHDQPTPLVMPQTPSMQGQAMPPMSPTPRVLNQPGNMSPTPHQVDPHAQAGMGSVPPTPHLPNQQGMLTPRIDEMDAAGNAPDTHGGLPSTNQSSHDPRAFFADERMAAAAAGMLAASGLEHDDDALYAPPTSQHGGLSPEPFTQDSVTPIGPAKGPARTEPPSKPLLEHRPNPGIIAFPSVPATPKATGKTNALPGKGTRGSGKLAAAPDAANANVTPGANPGTANQPDANPRGSGKPPATQNPANANAAPASARPEPTRGHGNTGKIAALGTPGSSANPGNTGKVAAVGAAGLGATALAGAAMAGNAGATSGGPGLQPQPVNAGPALMSSSVTNAVGANIGVGQRGAGRSAGPGMGQRPSGLTPLPPPYSRRARRRRNRTLLLLALLFLLIALVVVGVFAQHGTLPGLPASSSATVTLMPSSKLEADNYLISGLPSGTPDHAQLQVAARVLTQNSTTSTATANATGSVQAKTATGTLVFFNSTSSGITLGSTTLTGKDGVQIRFNGPVFVPATGSASTSAPGFAINSGSQGNISSFDIGGSCCAAGISVKNTSPFSGGQNAQTNSVIQQSDLDNAARPLISAVTQSTGVALQKQVKSSERVVDNTFQCRPTITSDHNPGDTTKTASVQVTAKCTEEVYDFAAAQQIATNRLQTKASNDAALGPQYALDGHIVASALSNTVVSGSGQVTIEMQAQGLWVYQFTGQLQQNIKQSLLKLSQADAQSMLAHQMGVASAKINISGGSSLPASANAITLVVQSLPGAQSTPTGSSSGSPTVIPSGTGIPAGPALTPTLTPVPGLGGS